MKKNGKMKGKYMAKEKVIVGLSGGVDSSVAAYLLKEQGYEVIGVTMQIWQPAYDEVGCGTIEAIEDARKVAESLNIPYHVLDFQETFQREVMDYFTDEYLHGRTPNPCVMCNRKVKWEALLDRAREFGADYIATGHYARIEQLENGRYAIKKSVTAAKDQTYALYNLTQQQLAHTLMPVGEYEKTQVRGIAEKLGIPVAAKKDSQDICFIPDNDYAGFLERQAGVQKPGNFVSVKGEVLGQHKGIIHYTIGQRKGLGIAFGHPVFVCAIRPETNEVVLGEAEDVFTSELDADQLNFMSVPDLAIGQSMELMAKIRYSHAGDICMVTRTGEDTIHCDFAKKVRAVTPGQAVVFYQGEYVAGGAVIR